MRSTSLFSGLLIVALGLTTGCDSRVIPHGSSPVVHQAPAPPPIDEAQFARLVNRDGLTLIKFGATWCGPCHMMDANLAEIETELDPLALTARIDTDENPELAQRFDVSSIPHTFLFKNGQVVDDAVGVMSGPQILDWVRKYR